MSVLNTKKARAIVMNTLPTGLENILDYSNIESMKDAIFYDMEGLRINKKDLQLGKVYVAVTPEHKSGVKFIKNANK